jgi:hypothetical protein
VTRTFAREPQAKVLIHGGASHAAEVALPNRGGSLEWMAARLKAKTGVDPLTIDQLFCASSSDALELSAFCTALPHGAHDVAVSHPTTGLFRGRPQWRIDAGAIAVELPLQLATANQRTLIEARFDSEPADTIPTACCSGRASVCRCCCRQDVSGFSSTSRIAVRRAP